MGTDECSNSKEQQAKCFPSLQDKRRIKKTNVSECFCICSPSPCVLQVCVHHGLRDIHLQQEKRFYLLYRKERPPCIHRGLRLCCQDTGKPWGNAGIPYPGFLRAKNPTTFNKGSPRVLTPMPQLT